MGREKTKPARDVVIWAIDPFEGETKPSKAMVERFLKWAQGVNADIQPVYVLSVPKDEVDFSVLGADTNQYAESAKRAAVQYLTDLSLVEAVFPPKIILSGNATRMHEAKRLLEYVDILQSPWIIVSSHGRKGFNRLVFGSFAENLLHQANCPVLFLTHLAATDESKPTQKAVLFPTDFSENSKLAFREFLSLARRLEFEVVLYHSITLPSIISPGWSTPGFPSSYFSEQEKWAKQEAKVLLDMARVQAVQARFIVKDDGNETKTGNAILEAAEKEGVQLIVMSSRSGAFESFLAGSTARDVFRANRYPVFIYGPKVFPSDGSNEIYQSVPAV